MDQSLSWTKELTWFFFLQIWFQFRLIWIADNCELQKWPSNKESTTPTGQRQGEQTRWKIYPSRVIFINFLRSAFAHSDPKSAKKTDGLTVFFALMRSGRIKADYWMLMKLNPIENSLKKARPFLKILQMFSFLDSVPQTIVLNSRMLKRKRPKKLSSQNRLNLQGLQSPMMVTMPILRAFNIFEHFFNFFSVRVLF